VIDSQDGLQYLAVARNIYYKGEPTGPLYEFNENKNIHMSTYIGKDGKTYSPTGLGFSLAYLPAVAITDMVYKYYNVSPPVHFPLESDWLIFLLASFTNSFFAASLGLILFLYFLALKIRLKQALLMSMVSLFATNLLVYSKHSVAHMVFTSFLVLAFFLVKKYSLSHKKFLLFFSAISYGIVLIAYNPTFLLPFPVLILYYLLLTKPQLNRNSFISILKDAYVFLLGLIPLMIIYVWFENIRAQGSISSSSPQYFSSVAANTLSHIQIPVIIEGLYGQLLSPGRSFFLYSPLILIILFFWHKIRNKIVSELIVFLMISIIYIFFFSTQYAFRESDQVVAELWHGESSWGPRYLTPLIPFGMLVVGNIFVALSKMQKIFIFLPLAILGLYIELLGIFMPYQIKYHNLESRFFINGIEYPVSIYSNFLPRFSPIYTMSKSFIKTIQLFPKTLEHGIYNVKFYDGVDFPFNVGPERWRVIDETGHISFDNNDKQPIKEIIFGIINHPIGNSSSSANLQFMLNNHPISLEKEVLSLRERKLIKIPIKKEYLKSTNNQLIIKIQFDDPNVVINHTQIIGLINSSINNIPINMESIDIPYISPLGPKMTGTTYQNYGGTNQDPWKTWQIHTQIFERVPDFWWVKAIYYWDFPKQIFLAAFLLNLSLVLFTAQKIYSMQKKLK
jgi:hypothetical protein